MEWAYVVLIVGSMVYSGSILVAHFNFCLTMRPQIAKLRQRAFELIDAAEAEMHARDVMRDRVAAHRPAIENAQRQVDLLREKLRASEIRRDRLEMALLKSSLRHTPRFRLTVS